MKTLLLVTALLGLCAIATASSPGNTPQTPKPHSRTQFNLELSPEASAKLQQTEAASRAFYKDGETALRAEDFMSAEEDFRRSISTDPTEPNGLVYLGLGEALAGQGQTAEAIKTYETIFDPGAHVGFGGSYFTRARLEYALLLDQTGRWAEAVAAFEMAFPDVPAGDLPKIDVRFAPDVSQPDALAAAAHVCLGLDEDSECDLFGEFDHVTAFREYTKAMELRPNWDVANYYYGYGWKQLTPAERESVGSFEQAKAALQKAARIGKGDVKKAAQKALRVAINAK